MNKLGNSAGIYEHRFFKTGAQFMFVFLMLLVSNFVMAQSTGGLAKATAAANEWKTWLYGFLGVCVFLFVMYSVILALLNKQSWMDVLGDLAKVAAAGGVLVAAGWAWSIWGT